MALMDVLKSLLTTRGQSKGESVPTPPPFPKVPMIGPVPVKTVEIGTTGTQIYAGYLSEDYLSELEGRDWAELVDKMRRSDPNVKMILSALKSPIKSSNWYVKVTEQSDTAEMQKKLIEKVLFEDINKSFTKFIGEALTMVDFGYSLFEITYQVNLEDKEIGTYNTLKSLAWRSQRTIEKWNVEPDGTLMSVMQIAYGDLTRFVDLDSRFLLHFSPEQEGDNFAGISVLRSCYGNWLRKNMYLKMLAAGMEKYAIPTPIMHVPANTQSSGAEYTNALNALQCYVSSQNNFMVLPEGWKLEFNNVNFDAEKIITAVDYENKEMVKSILASFLLLGQGSSGSFALSSTLSDFFSQSVTYLADHIIEQLMRKVVKPIIQMNMGDVPIEIEIVCDGLEDKATGEWATMLKTLVDAGLISPDGMIEDLIRERIKFPEKAEVESEAPMQAPIDSPAPPAQFAEKKKSKKAKSLDLDEPIRDGAKDLRSIFKVMLDYLGQDYIRRVINTKNSLPANSHIKAPNQTEPINLGKYVSILNGAYASISLDSYNKADAIFPKKKKKLSEVRILATRQQRIDQLTREMNNLFNQMETVTKNTNAANWDKETKSIFAELTSAYAEKSKLYVELVGQEIPALNRSLLNNSARAETLANTQINDLVKQIDLQYQSSLTTTDSDDQLFNDMSESLDDTLDGTILFGADIAANQAANETLRDVADAFEEETGDKIVSWTFVAVDDDKTTELCLELDGSTWEDGDPAIDKYTPPLHFNCRSYMQPNLASFSDNPDVSGLDSKKSTKWFDDRIQFSERKLKGVKK